MTTEPATTVSLSTKKSRTSAQRAAKIISEAAGLLDLYGGAAERKLASSVSEFAGRLYADAVRAGREAEGLCLKCGLPSPDSEYCAKCEGGNP